ncbi:PaaI family thioesterase [Microbulbifer sp. YPW16]|uniref:PaaI family thioesterase n=1 Tax=Microbulbifer sp. YPW16 TaxID=2904242 RepID=UPI001E49FD72|nr:PaaI family thioesterase [Microbulbifer sp. YPW16]UHQ55533.1 PaaI family thioesterase [Microbulbifer sp. YPW16]
MPAETAIQDQIPHNHCFGCGPENSAGLQIKSYWTGPDSSHCEFIPATHHCAGPTHYLNGGIIATVIDCHTICTAIADGYRQAGREVGTGDKIWYATGKLDVQYKAPAAIDKPVVLDAKITKRSERKTVLACTLSSDGRVCATADVVAVRVPDNW